MTSSGSDLLVAAGLRPMGPIRWGNAIACPRPGVYVIELPRPAPSAPIDPALVERWIQRVPSIRVDGERPTVATLANRLASFWFANETILYVGRAGTSVAKRIRQFYRTPLGDSRPHAGGHWLKTLSNLEELLIWWAETGHPAEAEDALLQLFAERHQAKAGVVLPFANRETAAGVRKAHGITHSTLARETVIPRAERSTVATPRVRGGMGSQAGGNIVAINAELNRLACATPEGEITAVDAAHELDRLGLLRDSIHRPGLPLRNLLRAGQIENAYQRDGRWWFIRCDRAGGTRATPVSPGG